MSVNKVIIAKSHESYLDLYLSGMSIPEVSEETGIHKSTIRHRLFRLGLIRTREQGIKIAADKGRLGGGTRGKKRVFTEEWKRNISKAKTGIGIGRSLKPSGYIDITMGKHKGRPEHRVVMEKHLGRKLIDGEVVHHIDHDKTNNDISNLALMTASEHAAHHAKERLETRERDRLGRFK